MDALLGIGKPGVRSFGESRRLCSREDCSEGGRALDPERIQGPDPWIPDDPSPCWAQRSRRCVSCQYRAGRGTLNKGDSAPRVRRAGRMSVKHFLGGAEAEDGPGPGQDFPPGRGIGQGHRGELSMGRSILSIATIRPPRSTGTPQARAPDTGPGTLPDQGDGLHVRLALPVESHSPPTCRAARGEIPPRPTSHEHRPQDSRHTDAARRGPS